MDERESKLPQWAQRELGNLRRKLADKVKRIDELTGDNVDTDTIANPYGDHPLWLPRGESVEFHLGLDRYGQPTSVLVRVERVGDRVHLSAMGGGAARLAVFPQSSNVVNVEVQNR